MSAREVNGASRVRLGFLGLGWIGQSRMRAIAQSGAAEIGALCDPDANAIAAARAVAPEAAVAASYAHLLELPLDGIVIATPSAQHAAQAQSALQRGRAVFCQKPLGRHAREVRGVVDAARRADRLLGVDLSYRHTRAVCELATYLRSGALGHVYAVNLVFHNAYGPDKSWFYDPELSGGGALVDLGIHLLDLMSWLLARPRVLRVGAALFDKGRPLRDRKRQVEDYATAQLLLESGTTVQLACSWRLHAGCECIIEASFYGTEGGVSLHNVNGSFYDFITSAHSGTSQRTLAQPPDDWGGRAAVAWAERLAKSPGFAKEADELVEVAELIDRIYASAQPEAAELTRDAPCVS